MKLLRTYTVTSLLFYFNLERIWFPSAQCTTILWEDLYFTNQSICSIYEHLKQSPEGRSDGYVENPSTEEIETNTQILHRSDRIESIRRPSVSTIQSNQDKGTSLENTHDSAYERTLKEYKKKNEEVFLTEDDTRFNEKFDKLFKPLMGETNCFLEYDKRHLLTYFYNISLPYHNEESSDPTNQKEIPLDREYYLDLPKVEFIIAVGLLQLIDNDILYRTFISICEGVKSYILELQDFLLPTIKKDNSDYVTAVNRFKFEIYTLFSCNVRTKNVSAERRVEKSCYKLKKD